jgi:putative flippase GtrA
MRTIIRRHRQVLVFIFGGGLSALIDIGLMQTLIFAGVNPLLAVSVGFWVSLLVNYAFHARVTFESRTTVGNLTRFACLVGINYLIALACVSSTLYSLDNALIGKLLSLPIIAINSFLLSKYWIYK